MATVASGTSRRSKVTAQWSVYPLDGRSKSSTGFIEACTRRFEVAGKDGSGLENPVRSPWVTPKMKEPVRIDEKIKMLVTGLERKTMTRHKRIKVICSRCQSAFDSTSEASKANYNYNHFNTWNYLCPDCCEEDHAR